MNNSQQRSYSMSNLWTDTPAAFKGGIAVAIIAWFVSLSSAQMTTVNGEVTSCSYFDIIKVGGAVLLAGLVIAGLMANAKSKRRALPTWLAATIAGVLIVVAVLLVIQGMGVAMSPCQA